jgi:hypothetical protein
MEDRTAARGVPDLTNHDTADAWIVDRQAEGPSFVAESSFLLKAERNKLWAEARLKGLPAGTPQRERIAELDEQIRALQATPRNPIKRTPSVQDGTASKA